MQTMFNVKPGDHARIVNSANGDKGLSVGRAVLVLADRPAGGSADAEYVRACAKQGIELPPSPYDVPHSEHGKIWPVQSLDGQPFYSEHGGSGMYVDVPDKWLVKIEPPPAVAKTKELELVNS